MVVPMADGGTSGRGADGTAASGATPAMAQWFAFKAAHPAALLFFRMGDFYELFFDDADAAAAALGIALTARGVHDGRPIPMCGVPVAAAEAYLGRLIRRGHRVAIVEQTEPGPSAGGPKRSGKAPLRRAVVRLVTPGTLTEDSLLDAGRPSLLVAVVADGAGFALAAADVAAGLVETERTASGGTSALGELLARLDPAEILAAEAVPLGPYEARRAPPRLAPPPASARARAAEGFGSASLDAFGTFSDGEATALALLLDYLRAANAGTLPRLAPPVARPARGFLSIDAATRSSLAIVRNADGTDGNTLLAAVRRTLTAAGERLLAARLAAPLDDAAAIRHRQAEWAALRDEPDRRARVAASLRGAPDGMRALGRIAAGRASPRDLASIRDALAAGHGAAAALAEALPPLDRLRRDLEGGRGLRRTLAAALAADLPARLDEGGVIADGVDPELDAARALARDGRQGVAGLGVELAARYGVPQLRIRHHAQLGYVIEVPQAAVETLRARPELVLRQGMANGARFGSPELASLDERIVAAAADAAARERTLFADLAAQAAADPAPLALFAALAALDVAHSSATIAAGGDWCLPTIADDEGFAIEACRHPVVEAALPPGRRFTPNDCDLASGDRRLVLLTGPNMAGKSTFLRQTALAVILAQSGLPVPAASARLGLVDRLFSRVGAADDLARGRSTFMVEMTETASILHAAGPRSLVVVDEIGRGTSTLDGLAIATAVLEALHSQVRCRGLFATHFHELAGIAERLPRLGLRTMRVREWRGEVVFQHEVVDGVAERSWGVHVARLAGVPAGVVARARTLLASLERERRRAERPLPLFAAAEAPAGPEGAVRSDPVHELLATLDPDALTPREAQEMLYRLKSLDVATRDGLSEPAGGA